MEKFTRAIGKFFGAGLLVLNFILFSPALFAQNARRVNYAELSVEPIEDVFFTNQESKFRLRIPYVVSSSVQVEMPNFPEGVVFNSSKREDFSTLQTESGILLEFVFTFENDGEITLPPLVVYIQGYRYLVPFKPVKVYQNPQTILPRVVVVFDNGETIIADEEKNVSSRNKKNIRQISLSAGAPACFTVYIQYAVQLQQFAWSIPKDSLFKELKRYDVQTVFQKIRQDKMRFSTERIPLAHFEWIPLAEGKTALPDIRLMATSYSGHATYLSMPECIVEILPPTENPVLAKDENFFAYAFTEEQHQEVVVERVAPDVSKLKEIAELRSQERHSFWQSKIREQRIAAEEEIGIHNTQDEPSVPIFMVFASVCVLFVLVAFVLVFVRKKFFSAFSAAFALVFLFLTVLFSHKVFERDAIVTGGTLSPVPEDSALTKTAAGEGTRVFIREEIDGWYYIEFNESGGWIKKENLVLIK